MFRPVAHNSASAEVALEFKIILQVYVYISAGLALFVVLNIYIYCISNEWHPFEEPSQLPLRLKTTPGYRSV